MVFNEQHLKRAGARRTKSNPSIFARPDESAEPLVNHNLSLSDLVMDYRPVPAPIPLAPAPRPEPAEVLPLRRLPKPRPRRRPKPEALGLLFGLGTTAALAVVLIPFAWFSGAPPRNNTSKSETTQKPANAPIGRNDRAVAKPPAQPAPPGIATAAPYVAATIEAPPVVEPPPREVTTTTPDRQTSPAANVPANEIAGWGTAIDPDGDCLINANDKALTVTVPATLHDLNAGINLYNAPRVLREVVGDFDIQVRVVGDFQPGNRSNREGGIPFNGAGIIVCRDNNSYIRLERGAIFDGTNFKSFAIFELHEGGSGVAEHNGPLPPGTAYLRLSRRGSRILGLTSTDGRRWSQLNPIGTGWPATLKVGVDAINSGSATFTVRFEELLFKTGKGNSARR